MMNRYKPNVRFIVQLIIQIVYSGISILLSMLPLFSSLNPFFSTLAFTLFFYIPAVGFGETFCQRGFLLYNHYGQNNSKSLLITITSISCLATVLTGLFYFINLYFPLSATHKIIVFCASCSVVFWTNFVHLLFMNKRYTCKSCMLTNIATTEERRTSSEVKETGYYHKGGIYTENYKVNGTDVTVEYRTEGEYRPEYTLISKGVEVSVCKICGKEIHRKKYKFKLPTSKSYYDFFNR